ncbi:MAG: tetratricopeptide repeat protein, partial [Candidatus Kapaibacterium sp.]
KEEIPSKQEELERAFANWLGFGVGAPILIVIDGVNQLGGHAAELHWMPPVMPPGVKLIVSSTVEQTLVDLRARGWSELGMQPLGESEREAVVVRFLAEYSKALSTDQVKRLATDVKCSHPLFLRTLLEELRLHGVHEYLDRTLNTLLSTTGTEDLFQKVLERLEEDYSQKVVREVLSLIWASRFGLSEEDMESLTGISRLKLSTLLLGLDYHLVRRDGVLSFFHDYLRRAVEKRYLAQPSTLQDRYRMLAEHFERGEMSLRGTRELLHALEAMGDRERLHRSLSDIERFIPLWKSEEQEVLRLWSSVEFPEIVGAYEEGLERWEREDRTLSERVEVLGVIGVLYDRVGAWSASELVQRSCLAFVREGGDRRAEALTLVQLGTLARHLGRMEESENLYRESEEIARELGDRRSIAGAVGNRGIMHWSRGEYPEALACYREQEEIARELGDRQHIVYSVGSRGLVHADIGEYADALACYREQEEIARELGDRRSIATAVGNRGIVHWHRGEYAEALTCYREQEVIARELGDRRMIATAVSNRGIVQGSRGEYAEAIACFRKQEEIARELGDRRSIALAVGNRGLAHADLGEYAEALACYEEQEQIAWELGDRRSIAYAVGSRGIVHASRGEYAEALACYEEEEEIARELGDRQHIAYTVGNRGILHYHLKEYQQALGGFQQAMKEHREISFGYGLSYWLEGTAKVLLDIAEQEVMPEYLREYVPNAEPQTWYAASLRMAREHAEECMTISEELSKPDTLFSGRVLLARITAAEGDPTTATSNLETMLKEATDDGQRAEVHYRLWKLNTEDIDHHAEAFRLYQSLLEKTPKYEYQTRIEELSRSTTRTSPETNNAAE